MSATAIIATIAAAWLALDGAIVLALLLRPARDDEDEDFDRHVDEALALVAGGSAWSGVDEVQLARYRRSHR